MYDGDTFVVDTLTFKVEFPYDEDATPPWERGDGYGPVSDWTTRDKAPGERVLVSDRGSKRYYDYAEAIKIAKRDAWGVKDRAGKSKGQIAAEAVEADYQFHRSWCNDEWHYVGVVVTLLDVDGNETEEKESVRGIEDNDRKLLDETARELAEEIADRIGDKSELVKVTRIRNEGRITLTL